MPPVRRRPAPQPAKKNEPSVSETKSDSEPGVKKRLRRFPTQRVLHPQLGEQEGEAPATRPPEQIPVPEPQTGPRLVIQMHDGTVVERFMSTIRRVTVENNQIVVVKKDGRIERTRMSEVLRMAIEP